jgi:hypothetical protein
MLFGFQDVDARDKRGHDDSIGIIRKRRIGQIGIRTISAAKSQIPAT